MNISEQARIFGYLQPKGFKMRDSGPEKLIFEKGTAIITILNNPKSLPVRIKTIDETLSYTAREFNDLMDYLEVNVK